MIVQVWGKYMIIGYLDPQGYSIRHGIEGLIPNRLGTAQMSWGYMVGGQGTGPLFRV